MNIIIFFSLYLFLIDVTSYSISYSNDTEVLCARVVWERDIATYGYPYWIEDAKLICFYRHDKYQNWSRYYSCNINKLDYVYSHDTILSQEEHDMFYAVEDNYNYSPSFIEWH